jgi:signal transduction histidine kinase
VIAPFRRFLLALTRRVRAPLPAGADGDAALVRRAAVEVAAQTAAAVAVVVGLVGALALLLTTRAQYEDIQTVLRQAAIAARTVDHPPPGVSLIIRDADGEISASPGTPAELAPINLSALRQGHSEWESKHGPEYALYTVDNGGRRVVAALDLRYRGQEHDRLIAAFLAASIAGIAGAGAAGWVIARRAVRPLGSALALQRRFVADASHELRTPLTILHTRAQLLQGRAGTDPKLRDELSRLVDGTRLLTEIVNDLLLSAQLQGRPDALQPADLTRIAAQVRDDFATIAQQDQVTLRFDAPASVVVAGVEVALRRAVSALVDNALGHNHPGGTITITVAQDERTATITVADDVDGLDPAEAAALTQRFARGPTANGHGRRFGIGLALVREVVDTHGGTLTLDGRPGAGATATITLPTIRD